MWEHQKSSASRFVSTIRVQLAEGLHSYYTVVSSSGLGRSPLRSGNSSSNLFATTKLIFKLITMQKQIDKINMSSSISLSTLLTVLFVGLKLCNVIDWSWIWVLSPLWIGWALTLIILIILIICVAFFD